ncbi:MULTISPECIES: condensation domain-containing protein [Actinomycetes]|uniref:HxxPF-repeated domain-containing protein n=1 Tax=Micromonospora echinofusca TaxID=47858 RepID=A0A1C5GGU5_MICEH|nr:condensation domain-containing protein [Micromonospora echinofusca]SCG18978.1 HxxPF-repeated domain-containing protein [Micromonospora echinofusca]
MENHLDRSGRPRATVYPASLTQSRLIKGRHAPGGPPAQIVGTHLLIRGALDVDRLRDALIGLVRRHTILRTNYAFAESGEVLAIVHPGEGPDVFTIAPATGLSDEDEIRKHVSDVLDGATHRFTSPDRHTMLQAILIPHTPGVHSLLLVIDHIAIDERSRAVLQRDLAALYAGRSEDLAEPYAYDSSAVRNTFPSIEDSPEILDLLTPLPPRFLTDLEAETTVPVVTEGLLGPEISARMGAAARRLGCTRFIIHVTALLWALKQFSGTDDVSLVTAVDTRLRPQDFDTVGFFQNLILLRSRSPRSAGLQRTFEECRTLVRDSLRRRDYPIASLIAHAAERREGGTRRNPLYQVVLAYAREDVDLNWALDGVDVRAMEIDHPQASIELLMFVTESPSDTNTLLIGAADVLGADDLHRLLALWRETVGELTRDGSVHPAGTRAE